MSLDGAAFIRLDKKLAQIENLDAMPLMERWKDVLIVDNNNGILKGEDGSGKAMAQTVRERTQEGHWVTRIIRGKRRRYYQAGHRAAPGQRPPPGVHNGSGPPLAPRGARSRVIANFVAAPGYDPAKRQWYVVGGWQNVVNASGEPFLHYHFLGDPLTNLPQRDLRGLRPAGKAQQIADYEAWKAAMLGLNR